MNRIDTLRKKAGLTVQELADKAGISRGYLNQLKNGMKRLNTDILARLADVLNCKIADLLSDEDNELLEAEKAGIDLELLQECVTMIRDEEKAQKKKFNEEAVIKLAVTLYEGAMEDRKAGIDAISVALARRIVKES